MLGTTAVASVRGGTSRYAILCAFHAAMNRSLTGKGAVSPLEAL
jgi:hypothetical protein